MSDHDGVERVITMAWRAHHASGSVFGMGKDGEPPKAAAVSVAFARLAAALKLPGVSHHTDIRALP